MPAPEPTSVADQEATVVIPAIGLTLPVVRGGQSVIDRGVAAHYDGPGWRPPVDAGRPGTYWLAAHHSTHGSPFANLPSVRPGNLVNVITGGHTYTYTVTSTQVVGVTVERTTVYGTDSTTARILLQTCEGAEARLLVHGVLTSVS